MAELFTGTDAIKGVVSANGIDTAFGCLPTRSNSLVEGEPCAVVIRSEHIQLRPAADSSVHIRDIRFLNGQYLLLLSADDASLRATTPELGELAVGTSVEVCFDENQSFVFSSSTL